MTIFRVAILSHDELRRGGAELIDSWKPSAGAKMWVDITEPNAPDLENLLEKR